MWLDAVLDADSSDISYFAVQALVNKWKYDFCVYKMMDEKEMKENSHDGQ